MVFVFLYSSFLIVTCSHSPPLTAIHFHPLITFTCSLFIFVICYSYIFIRRIILYLLFIIILLYYSFYLLIVILCYYIFVFVTIPIYSLLLGITSFYLTFLLSYVLTISFLLFVNRFFVTRPFLLHILICCSFSSVNRFCLFLGSCLYSVCYFSRSDLLSKLG